MIKSGRIKIFVFLLISLFIYSSCGYSPIKGVSKEESQENFKQYLFKIKSILEGNNIEYEIINNSDDTYGLFDIGYKISDYYIFTVNLYNDDGIETFEICMLKAYDDFQKSIIDEKADQYYFEICEYFSQVDQDTIKEKCIQTQESVYAKKEESNLNKFSITNTYWDREGTDFWENWVVIYEVDYTYSNIYFPENNEGKNKKWTHILEYSGFVNIE